jgi:hypothetical protein
MKKTRSRKHRNDYNHGKNGYQAGNRRHNRKRPLEGRGMGRARSSVY